MLLRALLYLAYGIAIILYRIRLTIIYIKLLLEMLLFTMVVHCPGYYYFSSENGQSLEQTKSRPASQSDR